MYLKVFLSNCVPYIGGWNLKKYINNNMYLLWG